MTPEQAADLAARTLAVAEDCESDDALLDYIRARVASDLALYDLADDATGLAVGAWVGTWRVVRKNAADGLARTAALYGVTP